MKLTQSVSPAQDERTMREHIGSFAKTRIDYTQQLINDHVYIFANLIQSQAGQTRGLREQLASSDSQNSLISALARNTVCTSVFIGKTFNSVSPNASLTLDHITTSTAAAAAPLFAMGCRPSATTAPEMLVQSIVLTEITATGTDQWAGAVRITFNPTGLIRALRPIETHINFVTNPASPPTAKSIVSCGGVTAYQTAQEFTLITNANQGSYPACINGDHTHIYVSANGSICAHSSVERYSSLAMNGFSICYLSGSKTTADDNDMYDGCNVRQVSPGNWKLESLKHYQDALLCRALCLP